MESLLYVYDIEKLNKMKKELSDFNFKSIAYYINLISIIDDDLDEIIISVEDKTIIDITNVIKDKSISIVFLERFLLTLIKTNKNISFSIQFSILNELKEVVPYLFNESEINYDYVLSLERKSSNIINKEKKLNSSLTLYTYKNKKTIKGLYNQGLAISIAKLFKEDIGIVLKYDIEIINKAIIEEEINYIDLSSLIKLLKVRHDLIFKYEMLICQIISTNSIKYIIEYSLKKEVLELFPLLFIHKRILDNSIENKEIEKKEKEININQINLLLDKMYEKFKGHSIFKKDFRGNLLKHYLFNKMNNRRILSILLCGESGVGKTEFAKIVSQVMYPNEKLIKINFGNYSTEGVLNSLIGSPLGYVGSEEGGELINKLISSKSKVILIDEFEKATPSVYNFFYELLEDGKFTDRQGKENDLREYIIVFTSNMTENQFQEHIPSSLKSRFDMVYNFEGLNLNEKKEFISETAIQLNSELKENFDSNIDLDKIKQKLNDLYIQNNLREIKRKIEDVVINEYIKKHSK